MSKLTRVFEFAASAWLIFGAVVGTWAVREVIAAMPLVASASYYVTEAIIVFGAC